MRDPRLKKLAQNLVQYSIDVQPGENVLIDMIGSEKELAKCLIEEVAKRGGRPFVELRDNSVLRTLLTHATKEQIELWAELDLEQMKKCMLILVFVLEITLMRFPMSLMLICASMSNFIVILYIRATCQKRNGSFSDTQARQWRNLQK